MRPQLALVTALVTAAIAAYSAGAHAFTCYQLFDRSDNVIYRSTLPPVDMSSDGDQVREALRSRGEYLMFVDFDRCPEVEFRFGEAGNRDLSIESVIEGITPMSQISQRAPPARPQAGRAKR